MSGSVKISPSGTLKENSDFKILYKISANNHHFMVRRLYPAK